MNNDPNEVEQNKFEIDEVVIVRFPSMVLKGKIIGPRKSSCYPIELIEDHNYPTNIIVHPVQEIFKIKQQ
jgi:hypothetical protein